MEEREKNWRKSCNGENKDWMEGKEREWRRGWRKGIEIGGRWMNENRRGRGENKGT